MTNEADHERYIRRCIELAQHAILTDDTPVGSLIVRGAAEDFTTLNYQVLLDDLVANSSSLLNIGYGPTLTPQGNYIRSATVSQITLDRYDLFLKIDDDDIYLQRLCNERGQGL